MKTDRKVAEWVFAVASSADNLIHKPKVGTTQLLYRQAERMGMNPSWLVPDGLFAVTVDGREKYINSALSHLNSHISSSLARDKHLTRLILARHKLQNIPFCSPQTQVEAAAFLKQHGKIIAKPLKGMGAYDVNIVTDEAQLEHLVITNYILEKYIVGKELRYLVLNGEVIGVHRSDYGVSVDPDRPLKRISISRNAWNEALTMSSLKVAQLLDLKFAAVDYLIDDAGCAYILEVNTSPGLKWFHAPTQGPVVDVAKMFMEAFLKNEKTPPVSQYKILVRQG